MEEWRRSDLRKPDEVREGPTQLDGVTIVRVLLLAAPTKARLARVI